MSDLPFRRRKCWLGTRRSVELEEGPRDLIVWMERRSGRVKAYDLVPPDCPDQAVREMFMAALRYRPGEVVVDRPALAEALAPLAGELGFALRVEAEVALLDDFCRQLEASEAPPLRFLAKADATVVERYLELAYDYLCLAPWETAPGDRTIRVAGLGPAPLWCSVLGSAGIERGLAVYLAGPPEPGRWTDAPCLLLSARPGEELPASLKAEIASHGWPVEPVGFPVLLRGDRSDDPSPLTEEFELVARVLEAVVPFLCGQGDVFELEQETVVLAWDEPARPEPGPEGLTAVTERLLRPSLADTPLSRAQSLAWKAMEAGRARDKSRLAHQALTLSADCADAYRVLAESEAGTLEEATELLRLAEEAGRRCVPESDFLELRGRLWLSLEARPYLRSLVDLMNALWVGGHKAEALEKGWLLLELNSPDTQGVRYWMSQYLAEMGCFAELEDLLQRYAGEPGAEWQYNAALCGFRCQGDTPATRERLERALATNQIVPEYLLGARRLPRQLPNLDTLGGDDEAQLYVSVWRPHWKRSRGALAWLRRQISA